jgi:hypothetical protein
VRFQFPLRSTLTDSCLVLNFINDLNLLFSLCRSGESVGAKRPPTRRRPPSAQPSPRWERESYRAHGTAIPPVTAAEQRRRVLDILRQN